jgi:thiamine-phosphate diphosphorylase
VGAAFQPPPLCAIVNADTNPHPVEFARELAASGCRFIQLRGKLIDDRTLVSLAGELKHVLGPDSVLIINDRADICRLTNADGVHAGQDDLPPRYCREIAGEGKIIGLSTHNLDQVSAAQTEPVDYLGFGPLFPSETKPDAHPPVTLDLLRLARSKSRIPIVAIGGITMENAAAAFSAGADCAAVIRDLEIGGDIGEKVSRFSAAYSASPRSQANS